MATISEESEPSGSGIHSVVLTSADIPGAALSEPYEAHAVPALKWWLLCRGIKAQTSWKKAQLIERIRKAVNDKAKVVDVDGSYLYRKYKRLADSGLVVSPLPLPSPPLSGWESVSQANVAEVAKKVPHVTSGVVYAYLASGAGHSTGQGTFRALTRGFIHWQSGRIDSIEVNLQHPLYCYARSQMKPSMKQGTYRIHVLLGREDNFASVLSATCECAAGASATCTHVSALLQALVAMTPVSFQLKPQGVPTLTLEDNLPVTSYSCQWKAPRKRKESNLPIAEATFEKHMYGKQRKRSFQAIEDFDPRPAEYRGTASQNLPSLLHKIRGEQLCISLLLDPTFRHSDDDKHTSGSQCSQLTPRLPDVDDLKATILAFKATLRVTEDEIRRIEQNTREQRNSSHWYEARCFRLTASLFGAVLQRRDTTPPDSLVMRIIQPRQFSSAAIEWGIQHESVAIKEYIKHQHERGHDDLVVAPSGFLVSHSHPCLGASPDGAVFDPSTPQQPYGFLEVKCPYSLRNVSPVDACTAPGFFCTLESNPDGSKYVSLARKHAYFAQVQMAIGDRPWCDFGVYTLKGLSVTRIQLDKEYWMNTLLPKLVTFYDNCVAPEIVSPVHILGIPMRNLSN